MAACIASLLEMNIDDVFQSQEYFGTDVDWGTMLKKWMNEQGYELIPGHEFICFHPEFLSSGMPMIENSETTESLKDKYYIVSGNSPRFVGGLHWVIYQNGQLIHDPHPEGNGVDYIYGFMKIQKIN